MTVGEQPLEVAGVYLPNGGARFMLAKATEALQVRIPSAVLAMATQFGPFDRRAALGLRQVVRTTGKGWGGSTISRVDRIVLGGRVRHQLAKYGAVLEADVGGLLDISGFAISDRWGTARARDRAERARRYHRRGRPVVFLPQSVGPLLTPDVREAFRVALSAADRFYVRDRASLEAAMDAAPPRLRDRLSLAPDLTLAADRTPLPPHDDASLVIVPNARLVDRGVDRFDRQDYVALLQGWVVQGRAAGLVPRVVVHTDEPGDRALAESVGESAGVPIEVVVDPSSFKASVGAGSVVVSSRFHALLGALSRGATCVAVGWAEKYDAVMADFALERFVHRAVDGANATELLREAIAHARSGAQAKIAAEVVDRADRQLQEVWAEVADLLDG